MVTQLLTDQSVFMVGSGGVRWGQVGSGGVRAPSMSHDVVGGVLTDDCVTVFSRFGLFSAGNTSLFPSDVSADLLSFLQN